ncbi:hypothetical protein GA0074695_3815 [Micromonospora viridifaciens]|uniref:Uncharacterized protein n=1 Tax=Micromonospora viridifaciens TaxID=1881 RepID=A0A1C4Y2W0_MICVI|nr:hypothetical protein [Micromonospora viridifaciens]SCF15048.1 hypothetical protein GA0074695_3815 [Micromonospora viridifaciens]
MAARHDDQPLTSMEFEAGSGDHGADLSVLDPPEAVELKARLWVRYGHAGWGPAAGRGAAGGLGSVVGSRS